MREVDERKADIIKDFMGDELWLYERGNTLAVGTMKRGNEEGFSVLLDAPKVDALIAALQKRRARMG